MKKLGFLLSSSVASSEDANLWKLKMSSVEKYCWGMETNQVWPSDFHNEDKIKYMYRLWTSDLHDEDKIKYGLWTSDFHNEDKIKCGIVIF